MNFSYKLALASIVFVSGGYEMQQQARLHDQKLEITRLTKQVANETTRLKRFQTERDDAVRLADETTASAADPVIASGDDAFDEDMRKLLKRVYRFKKWVESKPEVNVPELAFARDSQWFELVAQSRFKGEAEYYRAAHKLKRRAQFDFLPIFASALKDYLQVSHNYLPTDIAQLAPFLVHPIDPNLLARYEMSASGDAGNVPLPSPLIREKLVPSQHRNWETVSINGVHVAIEETAMDDSPLPASLSPEQKAALMAVKKQAQAAQQAAIAVQKYKMDHHGAEPTDMQALLPYVNDPEVLKNFTLPFDAKRANAEITETVRKITEKK